VFTANVCEGREAADARHVEVEQQEIGLGVRIDNDLQCVEAIRLDDLSSFDAIAYRMDQRLAKQWVIVCYDKCACVRQRRVLFQLFMR
jgi:hypothetical protein